MKYAIMFVWFYGQMALAGGPTMAELGLVDYDSALTREMVESRADKDGCLLSTDMYLKVIQKIDNHVYEVVGYFGYTPVSHGVIKVKGELNKGFFQLRIHYLGAKEFPLQSGFTAKYGIWEECKSAK